MPISVFDLFQPHNLHRAVMGTRSERAASPDRCPTRLLVKTPWVSQSRAMPITLDQIVEETRELPGDVVADLIDRILLARHGGVEPSVVTAWKAETDRRIAEIESGQVEGVPLAASLARARKRAGL